MSFAILQVVVQKLEQRAGTPLLAEVNKTMKLIQDDPEGGYTLDVEEIAELARPPMLTLPEYRAALVHRTGRLEGSMPQFAPDTAPEFVPDEVPGD